MREIAVTRERQASRIAAEMADLFEVDFESFALIQGDCPSTVAYIGRLGIYLGNWNDIRGPKSSPVPENDFVITVDDKKFDARDGMTKVVYEAMTAQDPNSHHPDYLIRLIGGGTTYPQTWLTGEPARPHSALVGYVDGPEDSKKVNIVGLRKTRTDVSFRPAVSLPTN